MRPLFACVLLLAMMTVLCKADPAGDDTEISDEPGSDDTNTGNDSEENEILKKSLVIRKKSRSHSEALFGFSISWIDIVLDTLLQDFWGWRFDDKQSIGNILVGGSWLIASDNGSVPITVSGVFYFPVDAHGIHVPIAALDDPRHQKLHCDTGSYHTRLLAQIRTDKASMCKQYPDQSCRIRLGKDSRLCDLCPEVGFEEPERGVPALPAQTRSRGERTSCSDRSIKLRESCKRLE
ncbi:hypothetical protein TNIN_359591 [Trichonephila inaurata madagascariensis]|uniref:Uncharacterized protein n=1 Tax=Trichonephila inaurata madagascariensis TaxID=2747483 RepID=A0A8X6XRZ2_9ARAC|nr:hypothetical protein TNIN_359591 [Trichonephila inaurata madagascariensis]